MIEREISRLGKARFKVQTNVVNDNKDKIIIAQLILNFNPLIERFNLQGNYQLIHWQARPRDYREWGIYSSIDDSFDILPR